MAISPLVLTPGRGGTPDEIYEHLRARILSGELPAGYELSQALVAKESGVSRGPVREAFRLLQREGLIDAEVNHRARVSPLSLQELEHVYALRVVNEAVALNVSVGRFSADDLDELDRLVEAVEHSQGRGFVEWEHQHQQFHSLLVAHAGERMRHSLEQWAEYTQRYRRVYVAREVGGWTLGSHEHGQIARACRARDAAIATALLANHLARAALTLMATMDPTHDPTLLRAAVRQVVTAARATPRP